MDPLQFPQLQLDDTQFAQPNSVAEAASEQAILEAIINPEMILEDTELTPSENTMGSQPTQTTNSPPANIPNADLTEADFDELFNQMQEPLDAPQNLDPSLGPLDYSRPGIDPEGFYRKPPDILVSNHASNIIGFVALANVTGHDSRLESAADQLPDFGQNQTTSEAIVPAMGNSQTDNGLYPEIISFVDLLNEDNDGDDNHEAEAGMTSRDHSGVLPPTFDDSHWQYPPQEYVHPVQRLHSEPYQAREIPDVQSFENVNENFEPDTEEPQQGLYQEEPVHVEEFPSRWIEDPIVGHGPRRNEGVPRESHLAFTPNHHDHRYIASDNGSPTDSPLLGAHLDSDRVYPPYSNTPHGSQTVVQSDYENHNTAPSSFMRSERRTQYPRHILPSSYTDPNDSPMNPAYDQEIPTPISNRNLVNNEIENRSYFPPQQTRYNYGSDDTLDDDTAEDQLSPYDDEKPAPNDTAGRKRKRHLSTNLSSEREDNAHQHGEHEDYDPSHINHKDNEEYYDAREIQNPPKRRKTTSGPLPRPAAEYNLNTLNTYSQYQDEATYVPMRTRGGEDTCEEKGFGKERKWWHRVSRSNGLQVRKKKTDPWRKAVRHDDIRDTLFRAAGSINQYSSKRAKGPEGHDQTSYLPFQKRWSLSHRDGWKRIYDNVLMRFERRDYRAPETVTRPRGEMMYGDRVVVDRDNRPIIDWPILPLTLSSQFEGGYMEAIRRICPGISTRDFWARMPEWIRRPSANDPNGKPVEGYAAINMRCTRFREKHGLVSWTQRSGTTGYKDAVRNALYQQDRDNNSTEHFLGLSTDDLNAAKQSNKDARQAASGA